METYGDQRYLFFGHHLYPKMFGGQKYLFLVIKNILTHISLLTNVGTSLSEGEGF